MRRIVIVVPDLLGDPEAESPLRQSMPALSALTEAGVLAKLAPMPKIETPEALYLGLRHDEAQMRQGPLTVSALGADPPERSTHFHLSPASFDGSALRDPGPVPTPEEVDLIIGQSKRLQTPLLTVVHGEEWDHGLVWEALGDLGTTAVTDAYDKGVKSTLPEGDGERLLRRFVDDSVNVLNDLEFNQRRIDEGFPPVNVLWPWGHGTRRSVPNLVLRRGEVATVESGSLRLAGLTRLTGYRHASRRDFGRGTRTRLRKIAERALTRDVTIAMLDAVREFRQKGMEEELHWFVRELDRELLQPLLEKARLEPSRITLLAPSSAVGLALTSEPQRPEGNFLPFDERALEERTLPTRDLWQAVELGVTL